jgi:hypothetical protein
MKRALFRVRGKEKFVKIGAEPTAIFTMTNEKRSERTSENFRIFFLIINYYSVILQAKFTPSFENSARQSIRLKNGFFKSEIYEI